MKGPSLPIIDRGEPAFNATQGATNQLAVVARGTTISAFVNGHRIASVTESTNGKGIAGITVDAPNQGNAEVVFTNAELWTF